MLKIGSHCSATKERLLHQMNGSSGTYRVHLHLSVKCAGVCMHCAFCIMHHASSLIYIVFQATIFIFLMGYFSVQCVFFFILFLHFDDESKLFITLRQSVKSVSSHIRNRDKILMFQWNGMECAPF